MFLLDARFLWCDEPSGDAAPGLAESASAVIASVCPVAPSPPCPAYPHPTLHVRLGSSGHGGVWLALRQEQVATAGKNEQEHGGWKDVLDRKSVV